MPPSILADDLSWTKRPSWAWPCKTLHQKLLPI